MYKKVYIWLFIITMTLLPACNFIKDLSGGNKIKAGECPTGLWWLKGGEAFARATIPVGAMDQNTLSFRGGAGAIYYDFQENGILTVLASPLLARFDSKLDETVAELEITMNGVASAEYNVKGKSVQVGDVIRNEIGYRATLDGEEMMSSSVASDFLPLFVSPYNAAEFICMDGSLFLTIADLPGNIPSIEFVRIQPTPTP